MVAALLFALPAVARTADQNRATAVTDAGSLLAAAGLPDGATQLSAEPAGDGGVLTSPPALLNGPNLVTRTAFYRTETSAAEVLSFVGDHAPAGAVAALSGSADTRNGHSYDFRGFQRPAIPGVLSLRALTYAVSALDDGGTGIRVDAQVRWLSSRPAAETIPGSARELTITSGRRVIRVAGAKRAQQLARLLNQLDVVQPGAARACPLALTNRPAPRLVFRSHAGGRVLATALIHPDGCASADMNVGGKAMPALDVTGTAGNDLLAALKTLRAL
ncbi:MAG: hypothetical protein QOC55_1816 [Thermoleophilaceae bacterium]|jgi:hypothetical protein|nr:hypothetical protein [Thermoleophilaceae bacterium]